MVKSITKRRITQSSDEVRGVKSPLAVTIAWQLSSRWSTQYRSRRVTVIRITKYHKLTHESIDSKIDRKNNLFHLTQPTNRFSSLKRLYCQSHLSHLSQTLLSRQMCTKLSLSLVCARDSRVPRRECALTFSDNAYRGWNAPRGFPCNSLFRWRVNHGLATISVRF